MRSSNRGGNSKHERGATGFHVGEVALGLGREIVEREARVERRRRSAWRRPGQHRAEDLDPLLGAEDDATPLVGVRRRSRVVTVGGLGYWLSVTWTSC